MCNHCGYRRNDCSDLLWPLLLLSCCGGGFGNRFYGGSCGGGSYGGRGCCGGSCGSRCCCRCRCQCCGRYY